MSEDEKTPTIDEQDRSEPVSAPDDDAEAALEPDDLDDDLEAEQLQELPGWLDRVLESARRLPGGTRRVAVWLPTLAAGWRAAERGMAVASALRQRLDEDEPLQWPDELAEEFGDTLREFGAALPEFDEAVPIAADLVELGEQFVDGDSASEAVLEVTRRLERLAENALQRLLEVAFFAPEPEETKKRNRQLRNLFGRLEELFDRLLYLWLFGDDDEGK